LYHLWSQGEKPGSTRDKERDSSEKKVEASLKGEEGEDGAGAGASLAQGYKASVLL